MNDGVSVFLAGVLFRHHHFRTEVALSWSVAFVSAPPYSTQRSCGAWTAAKWAPPILHYPAIPVCWNDPCSQISELKFFKPKPGTSHRTRNTMYWLYTEGLMRSMLSPAWLEVVKTLANTLAMGKLKKKREMSQTISNNCASSPLLLSTLSVLSFAAIHSLSYAKWIGEAANCKIQN